MQPTVSAIKMSSPPCNSGFPDLFEARNKATPSLGYNFMAHPIPIDVSSSRVKLEETGHYLTQIKLCLANIDRFSASLNNEIQHLVELVNPIVVDGVLLLAYINFSNEFQGFLSFSNDVLVKKMEDVELLVKLKDSRLLKEGAMIVHDSVEKSAGDALKNLANDSGIIVRN